MHYHMQSWEELSKQQHQEKNEIQQNLQITDISDELTQICEWNQWLKTTFQSAEVSS